MVARPRSSADHRQPPPPCHQQGAFHPERDSRFRLDGDPTLRGVTTPVTIRGEFGGIVEDAVVTRAGEEARVNIDRHDFGVSWNAALGAGGMTLGDDVAITYDLEFTLDS